MFWHSYKPYIPVAARRAQAAKQAAKLAKTGQKLDPVRIEGRKIAHTFWGKAWCDNLESYSDYENRLPRGRTYARNGSVIDLQIASGKVTALVQGSSLYHLTVTIAPLPPARWKSFLQASTGHVTNLLDLLQGKLPEDLLAAITDKGNGLFPSPQEIKLDCNCPDWADMCKHVAAVLYGVGARLDARPELFFTLRGVDMKDLVTAAGETAATPLGETSAALHGEDLSALFGIEIENAPPAPLPQPLKTGKLKTGNPKKTAAKIPKKTGRKKAPRRNSPPKTK